jgi:GTP:adenosylcobinamide-phosphate guanylyltransferase
VLAVIAAWHASDETEETASAIPRTRSKTRPGPLAEVVGKPMVFHAWHAAHVAKCVTRCVVATDDDAVETAALAFGARVVRVDEKRRSEKELKNRFASVAAAARATAATRRAFDAVVVVDADEAFVEAHHIERVADAVIDSDAQSATCVRARDALDARNDHGRVFLVVAEPTPANATPKTPRRARYVTRVFSEMDASVPRRDASETAARDEDDENGKAESPTREQSHSPKSPLASSRSEDARASRLSFTKNDAKKDKSVGVEVGVRSYVASALFETLELSSSKKGNEIKIKTASDASLGHSLCDEDEAFRAKRRTCSSASGDEENGENGKNERRRLDDHLGPTREALLLGWRVAAVRSEESSDRNLGGLKTQRSLDAKNARIRAGEIRLAHA